MNPEASAQFRATVGLLKRVPSGVLRMGSPFHPREWPATNHFVPEFEIGHAPVTVSQYGVFLDSGASTVRRWWSDEGWRWRRGELDGWGRENRGLPDRWSIQKRRPYHPVVSITWFEVQAYCAWLSDQTKQTVRLAFEEEWERAARGGDRRPFPWGEEFSSELANTIESDRRDTVPAASLDTDRSPFGVLDMAGNVQEWTASDYIPLEGENFPSGPLKVARGGSFNDTSYGGRTSYRRAYPPGYFFPFLGFRVVVERR
ncbi:MAG: SUMF1/EgtB/PvdO family nonheme iron enzyme [Anaerolineales bacterium]|nr:SUMF1/EgtB/PvdO family nonheme iron enzyme [Anaerolineales bacterium]